MKQVLVLSFLCWGITGFSQSRILTDGRFDDWTEYPVAYSDATGDGRFLGADFQQLFMHNDEDYLFFLLEVGFELDLQESSDIVLYLDTDDNANTGFSFRGIGAELVYSFTNRSGTFYGRNRSTRVFHDDIGLITAPTVTSDRFEIAINRNSIISGEALFAGDIMNVIFSDNSSNGDVLPAQNEELKFRFSSANIEPLPEYSLGKQDASNLRIMSYNVLRDGLFVSSRFSAFQRIFKAIQPDIIGFQEIYQNSSAQVANRIEMMLPSGPDEEWYHAMEGPDCHIISRYPVLESALIPGHNQGSGNGAFLIDLPDLEEHMLVIVAHPPCCENDTGRQIEVDQMMQFLREAKDGTGPIPLEQDAPIIILGDMNFVGDSRQLETLITGDISNEFSYGPDFSPDWDGNDLIDAHPYSTGVPFSFTWYDEGSSFTPGRLDFMIYSGSNLELKNSYTLFTPGLSQDSLDVYDIWSNDVVFASDHLPVVADFELRRLSNQDLITANKEIELIQLSPNPSAGIFWIQAGYQDAFSNLIQEVTVLDADGKTVLYSDQMVNSLDLSHLSYGNYFVEFLIDNQKYIQQVTLLK